MCFFINENNLDFYNFLCMKTFFFFSPRKNIFFLHEANWGKKCSGDFLFLSMCENEWKVLHMKSNNVFSQTISNIRTLERLSWQNPFYPPLHTWLTTKKKKKKSFLPPLLLPEIAFTFFTKCFTCNNNIPLTDGDVRSNIPQDQRHL